MGRKGYLTHLLAGPNQKREYHRPCMSEDPHHKRRPVPYPTAHKTQTGGGRRGFHLPWQLPMGVVISPDWPHLKQPRARRFELRPFSC